MNAGQEKQKQMQAHLNAVLNEFQQAQQGTAIRQKLIKDIEALDAAKPRRLLIYIGNIVIRIARSIQRTPFHLPMRSLESAKRKIWI
jgi:hypothetical protein